ncbi:hypothetical protein [Pontivivens insulae]|uniref:Uncharacterized protein n=1 Tax=Pontivivens insulae TaxID=1639689 RepID=A0A2R8AEV7_9RHOB|nr:hypothetical protein [Pontivivens insulae]RED12028.1 hypothetical protein DFR53_2741 [Pontivivens insulae]SPF30784.1 hypothetical protein POI8812_03127 [Pontivivens insulae]
MAGFSHKKDLGQMSRQKTPEECRKAFLFAACTQLGFCLPPADQAQLVRRTDLGPEEFIRLALELEGLEPLHLESYEHFRTLRDLYKTHVEDNATG